MRSLSFLFLSFVFLLFSAPVLAQNSGNPCPAGQFMDSKGECHTCQDSASVLVSFNETAQASCHACGNRVIAGNMCQLKSCARGQQFRDDKGACVGCGEASAYVVGYDTSLHGECRACMNRDVAHPGICHVKVEECRRRGSFLSENYHCTSCDVPEKISVGKNQKAIDSCMACGNREVIGTVCQVKPTACRKGSKFQGQKGSCYDCASPESIEIGKNLMLQHSCNACPGRFATRSGYCLPASCPRPNQFRSEREGCFDCLEPRDIYIGFEKNLIDMCRSCNRQVNENLCSLAPTTAAPQAVFLDMAGNTHACSMPGSAPMGYDMALKEACLKCGNRFVNENNLCLPMLCPAGGQFMDAIGFCRSCQVPEAVFIGFSTPYLQEMCTACGRHFSNGYCTVK
ncbi:MAG: hypothetical protein LBU87_05835 [Lactobacillales bacterium]|nr:hypothetical protein [Lactobacillales bacterium]